MIKMWMNKLKVVEKDGKFTVMDGNIGMETYDTRAEADKMLRYFEKADKVQDELERRLGSLIDELTEGEEDTAGFHRFIKSYFGGTIELELEL